MEYEIAGYIGAACLALCGLPQAMKCIRDKNADSCTWMFVICLFIGTIAFLVYVIKLHNYPLIINYGINFLSSLVMLRYKIPSLYTN